MANQYSEDQKGLGEYCPRPMIRMSEEQFKQFCADAQKAGLNQSHYARCKLGLEPWPSKLSSREKAKGAT
jgi:hypothetical protein